MKFKKYLGVIIPMSLISPIYGANVVFNNAVEIPVPAYHYESGLPGKVFTIAAQGDGIKLTVDATLNEDTLKDGIRLTSIRNEQGDMINQRLDFTFVCDTVTVPGESYLALKPTPKLTDGYIYKCEITTVVVSNNGDIVFPSGVIRILQCPLDNTMTIAAVLYRAYNTRVSFSPNAIPTKVHVALSGSPVNDGWAISGIITEAENKYNLWGQYRLVIPQTICTVKMFDPKATELSGSHLSNMATITFSYPDSDRNGYVDGLKQPVRSRTLRVAALNETNNLWTELETWADEGLRTVTARIPFMATFAVLGAPDTQLADVYAYPVPFDPENKSGSWGNYSSGITFANVSNEATIRIFTVSGDLVRTIKHSDLLSAQPGQEIWDIRNSAGELVASDVYLYVVENERSRKTGKLVIIR